MTRTPTERDLARQAFIHALVTTRPDLYDAHTAYDAYYRKGGVYVSMFRAGRRYEAARIKRARK